MENQADRKKSKYFYYSLYSITGASATGYGFILTLFAELKEEFGFSETEVGLIGAIGFLSGFFAQITFARYADRGHSAVMIRIGMALSGGAAFWMIFSDEFWEFFAARFFLGMAAALITPGIRRIMISRSVENMGNNLGTLASVELAGFAMGPVLSAFLAEWFGIDAPFIALASIYGAFFIFVNVIKLESQAATSTSKRVVRELLKIPRIQAGVLMTVALFATIGAFEVSWALYLDDLGSPTWLIGVGISLFGLPLIFLAPFGGRLAQRIGPIRAMTYSVIGAAVCTLSYGFIPLIALLLVVSVIHGAFDAVTYPAAQVAVAMASPQENIAAGQGLLSAVGLLTAGVIAAIGGVVYEWGGEKVLYSGTAVLMLVVVVLSRYFDSRQAPVVTKADI